MRDRGPIASRGGTTRGAGRVVIVALLVVLAGCGSIFDRGLTPTASPAPVPDGPRPGLTTLGPGIPPYDAVNATELLAAHDAALRGGLVRVVDSVIVNGSALRVVARRTLVYERRNRLAGSFLYATNRLSEPHYVSITRNGSGLFVTTTLRNGTRYTNETVPPGISAHLPARNLTHGLLGTGRFEAVGRDDDVVRLAATDPASLTGLLPAAFRRPHNVTATLTVTPSGRITQVSVGFEAVRDGDPVTVSVLRDVAFPSNRVDPSGNGNTGTEPTPELEPAREGRSQDAAGGD